MSQKLEDRLHLYERDHPIRDDQELVSALEAKKAGFSANRQKPRLFTNVKSLLSHLKKNDKIQLLFTTKNSS